MRGPRDGNWPVIAMARMRRRGLFSRRKPVGRCWSLVIVSIRPGGFLPT